MKIICSWCSFLMGSKEPLDDPTITHGICAACYQVQLVEIEAAKPADVGKAELSVKGRYPAAPCAVLDPCNMMVETRLNEDGTIVVRVDDRANLDFWLEIVVPVPTNPTTPKE